MAPEKRERDLEEQEDERRVASDEDNEERTPLGQKGKLSAEDDNDSGGG
jgi:hypothetical protein